MRAPLFQRADDTLHHAILLWAVWCDEFLPQATAPGTRHRQHAELTFLPVLQTATGGVLDCASIDKRIRSTARGAVADLVELLMRDQVRELPSEIQTVLASLGKRHLLHGYAQGIAWLRNHHHAQERTDHSFPR